MSINICITVEAPQGSVLSAILFKFQHFHFLPKLYMRCDIHNFSDDLAILMQGSIDKHFDRK